MSWRTGWRTWCRPGTRTRRSRRCRSAPRRTCLLPCGVCACVSWVARHQGQLGAGGGVAGVGLAGRSPCPLGVGGALVSRGVGVGTRVAALRVEMVELEWVAALPGLTVGVAPAVDRRSIRLGVQVFVAAGDGGGAAA